jgi:hypothetical protein
MQTAIPPAREAGLRPLLESVPDRDLATAIEAWRAARFVDLGFRLCRALEGWLAGGARVGRAELEHHFHWTHDDLGFGLAIGAWQLEMDDCQAHTVRLRVHRAGEGGEERRIPLGEMTPERARAEVLAFASLALLQARDGAGSRVEWISHPDPAMRPTRRAARP